MAVAPKLFDDSFGLFCDFLFSTRKRRSRLPGLALLTHEIRPATSFGAKRTSCDPEAAVSLAWLGTAFKQNFVLPLPLVQSAPPATRKRRRSRLPGLALLKHNIRPAASFGAKLCSEILREVW